jgi:hypothetical protein
MKKLFRIIAFSLSNPASATYFYVRKSLKSSAENARWDMANIFGLKKNNLSKVKFAYCYIYNLFYGTHVLMCPTFLQKLANLSETSYLCTIHLSFSAFTFYLYLLFNKSLS